MAANAKEQLTLTRFHFWNLIRLSVLLGAAVIMIMHTKGPWGSKRLATYNDPGHVILWPDKGGSHMRRLDSAGSFTAADAALISAAPELLSACKALLDVLSASYGTQKPVPLNCPEASKAHAAINKAEEVLSAW